MKKFIGGKKAKKSSSKTKTKAKKEEVSPLMATEPESKDQHREDRRKERDARRKERDDRLADNESKKESKKNSKNNSKTKSKPKLSREEQDAKDSKLGCCHQFGQFLVKIIHVIDGLIGLTFVIYGALINKFDNPAMEAVITCLTFGSVMLFTSIMGVIGFYYSGCNRFGLALSAITAPFIAFFYLVAIISVLGAPDKFFDYLTKHKDVLYLNDAEILTLRNILPVFYIILASLAAAEICRFIMLRQIRLNLIKYDNASQRILSEHTKNSSKKGSGKKDSKKGSSKKDSKKKEGSERTGLTEPLIDEEHGLRDSDGDY